MFFCIKSCLVVKNVTFEIKAEFNCKLRVSLTCFERIGDLMINLFGR